MKNEELELYDTLDMCNWYRELLSMYNCDSKEIMRKHDRKVIEKIIQEFGYCSIYYSESKIFSIITLFGGIEFQCNFEIKDGLVNIYLISYCHYVLIMSNLLIMIQCIVHSHSKTEVMTF